MLPGETLKTKARAQKANKRKTKIRKLSYQLQHANIGKHVVQT